MIINIDDLSKVRVLVVGDLMFDEYLWGNVKRVSPEAPVPIVNVQKQNHTLGGAGNVISNLVAMKAKVFAIGTVGKDEAGANMAEMFKKIGIKTNGIISEPFRHTTRKTRIIAEGQHVLRVDKETNKKVNNNTLDKILTLIQKKIADTDLIIISDYNKGLVSKKLVKQIVKFAKQYNKMVLADPKALNFSKYKNVSVLTPNKKEAGLAANMDINSTKKLFRAGEIIIKQACLEKLLITCGKDGMALFEKDKKPFLIKSKAKQVFDVSGAGDTVISLLGLGLAIGADFNQSAILANTAAGIVIGKIGTAVAKIDELKREYKKIKSKI